MSLVWRTAAAHTAPMLFGLIWLLVAILPVATAVRGVGYEIRGVYRYVVPAAPPRAGRVIFNPPEHRR